MGISGLLPLLKSIQKPCSLKKFSGQTIGVDAYGWLHRGTATCAIDLAQDKPTTKFVDFAMNRVRMLVHFGITPYIVFDGDYLPGKAGTEKERAERRKEGKRLGLELLNVGKTSQAHQELQKAVDVTPEMARMLIEELKHHNIQYVVAPYEADSQLAYLERKGIINGVLSEDSDLLVFGVKCLITKLDKYGECVEVNRNHFTACREISLVGWTDADFRRMAILSGCDYLPGIGNMGLKTAYRMLRKHKNVERLVKAAQFDGKYKVPSDYMEAFYQAEKTFIYQWVFCPLSKQLVNLTTPDAEVNVAQMAFIGEEVPSHIAFGVARGELHPHSKQPLKVRTDVTPSGKPLRPARTMASTTQTPTGKHSKPIESFFKPKRTPLAELDINLFTPSPSQQVLLEQQRNTIGWQAVPAPQTTSQQRPSHLRTAPQSARRTILDSAALMRSAPNPSKRQRLCSDSMLGTPKVGAQKTTTSRFFASFVAEPSPSDRPNKHRRKTSGQAFHLYSDDSVEDVMAELADLDQTSFQPQKKLKVFNDSFASTTNSGSQTSVFSRSASGPSQTSQSTVVSTLTGSFQDSQNSAIVTPATSHGSPEPETVFSGFLSKQVKALRSKCLFDADKASPFATEDAPPSGSALSTPLKRTLSATTSEVEAQTPPQKVTAKQPQQQENRDVVLFEDSVWAAMGAEVVVAASDSETSPRPSTPIKRHEVRGSEELLVPDSDAESICSPRKPLLNIGRFAFNG